MKNGKRDLYLDFDSTIVNSDKAFCDAYNELYAHYEGFVPAEWEKVSDWAFESTCPLIHELHKDPVNVVKGMFGLELFFKDLQFYDDAKEVIEALSHEYNIIICTSAFPKNASLKVLWIEEHLPVVNEVIVLINKGANGFGKGRVTMLDTDAIFIDDHPENLRSTQATHKYLYKNKETNYNEDWEGNTVSSWLQIKELLL